MLRTQRHSKPLGLPALACWAMLAAGAGHAVANEGAHGHGVGAAKPGGHGNSAGTVKAGSFHPNGAQFKPTNGHAPAGLAKTGNAWNHLGNASGKEHNGGLARLEHDLEREMAELRQLEQSLDNLLDSGSDGGSSAGGGGGGGGGGGPGGFGNNNGPMGQPNNDQQPHRHHRHGHMWHGLGLARLMADLGRQERGLARLEGNLHHELGQFRDLQHNLRGLDRVGQTANRGHLANHGQSARFDAAGQNGREGGIHFLSHSPNTTATHLSSPTTQNHAQAHSHTLSGAHSAGSKISSQKRGSSSHHH